MLREAVLFAAMTPIITLTSSHPLPHIPTTHTLTDAAATHPFSSLHHHQIMESLGGDQLWFDRFAAQHAAILYYWILLGLYVFSPRLAYNFSELIEYHAVDTYGTRGDGGGEGVGRERESGTGVAGEKRTRSTTLLDRRGA